MRTSCEGSCKNHKASLPWEDSNVSPQKCIPWHCWRRNLYWIFSSGVELAGFSLAYNSFSWFFLFINLGLRNFWSYFFLFVLLSNSCLGAQLWQRGYERPMRGWLVSMSKLIPEQRPKGISLCFLVKWPERSLKRSGSSKWGGLAVLSYSPTCYWGISSLNIELLAMRLSYDKSSVRCFLRFISTLTAALQPHDPQQLVENIWMIS